MQPFFTSWDSGAEEKLVEFFEKRNNHVEWWFKNGDRDATFFAVPYEDGDQKPFYVDFIVRMKDGRIGLFDPHGTHLGDFTAKSDGLQAYIAEQNKRLHEIDDELYYSVDERNHSIDLTEQGREFMASGTDKDMFVLPDVGTEMSIVENDSTIPHEQKQLKKDEIKIKVPKEPREAVLKVVDRATDEATRAASKITRFTP